VIIPVQPAAQLQAARSSNTTRFAVILAFVALFVVVLWVVALSMQRTGTETSGATENSNQKAVQNPGVDATYCKNFPFDEKCPNPKKLPSIAHQPDQSHSGDDPSSLCLEMVRKSGDVDEFGTTITGTVRNNCGKDFSYVEVTFKLFDRAGNVVGTALANQTNLKAGETWKFKAFGTPAAHHDRFDEIRAY
jgi:hypothetical protein